MKPWHRGRVICIGDAAHATSPQLGQGVNLALVDAQVIARCLARATSFDHALSDFYRERARQVRFYQFASRALTPLFQSDSSWLGPVRDVVLPLLGAFPPTAKQMLKTMAGIKRGCCALLSPFRAGGVSGKLTN